jgi:glycosyltransferase involved in cell wall biosynthesis
VRSAPWSHPIRTTYEETSLAALEAVASGTPCVLTRQCEIPGLHPGGGLVTECDPAAFAAGLSAVLTDSHRADRARFARERILAMETAEHRAQLYAELFRSIVGEPSRVSQKLEKNMSRAILT